MTTTPTPPGRHSRRDALYLLLVGIALLVLIIGAFRPATPGAGGALPGTGRPRDVDLPRLQRLIDQRQLSDHEARYYRPVSD